MSELERSHPSIVAPYWSIMKALEAAKGHRPTFDLQVALAGANAQIMIANSQAAFRKLNKWVGENAFLIRQFQSSWIGPGGDLLLGALGFVHPAAGIVSFMLGVVKSVDGHLANQRKIKASKKALQFVRSLQDQGTDTLIRAFMSAHGGFRHKIGELQGVVKVKLDTDNPKDEKQAKEKLNDALLAYFQSKRDNETLSTRRVGDFWRNMNDLKTQVEGNLRLVENSTADLQAEVIAQFLAACRIPGLANGAMNRIVAEYLKWKYKSPFSLRGSVRTKNHEVVRIRQGGSGKIVRASRPRDIGWQIDLPKSRIGKHSYSELTPTTKQQLGTMSFDDLASLGLNPRLYMRVRLGGSYVLTVQNGQANTKYNSPLFPAHYEVVFEKQFRQMGILDEPYIAGDNVWISPPDGKVQQRQQETELRILFQINNKVRNKGIGKVAATKWLIDKSRRP